MTTKKSISKAEINDLPLRGYEGSIQLVNTQAQLETALEELHKEQLLGFDTETKPAYRSGESYLPSVLQLASMRTVYVFQLQQVDIPNGLDALLSNSTIVKAGVAIRDDITGLNELFPFEAKGFVELSTLATTLGYENNGLRSLAACLLGFRISKAAQQSNWARQNLTEVQLRYAATDAWVGRELYKRFERIRFDAVCGPKVLVAAKISCAPTAIKKIKS